MNQNWLEHPTLKKMDPRKRQILLNIQKQAAGKSLNQCLPLIMEANTTLQAQNLSFTPEESNIMMQMLTQDMSPQDMAKFEMMKSMMNNMNRQQRRSQPQNKNNKKPS